MDDKITVVPDDYHERISATDDNRDLADAVDGLRAALRPHDQFFEDDAPELAAGRYKLWELDPGSHCSIIGTCLSLEDLRRITRKIGIVFPANAQDFDIHGYFVKQAGCRSPVSKLIHKTLDRKYSVQIARFGRGETFEALWELWRQAMTNGDIAGSYWALMTHKAVPEAMSIQACREIHMLSHLMGRSNRDGVKRIHQLETTCTELKERLEKTRARADDLLRERDARIQALEALAAAWAGMPRTRPSTDMLLEIRRREGQLGRLRTCLAVAERRLKAERARARAAESRLSAMAEGRHSRAFPEPILIPDPPSPHERSMTGLGGDGNLEGWALLYVGGYRDLTPHLRAHVERMRGTFLYHDGGFEMQSTRLPGLVSQADAVFCPVGCVSHDACLRLKSLCKRHGKSFVLLRSAGLSGFVSAVKETMRDVQGGRGPASRLVPLATSPAPDREGTSDAIARPRSLRGTKYGPPVEKTGHDRLT